MMEDGVDIGGLRALVISGGGVRGEPHAAQIGDNDSMIARQLRGEWGPHVPSVAKPVYEYDRRPTTADADL